MQKPITVARREFVESMNELMGNSGLPLSMLADIFKDAFMRMQALEEQQYEQDKKAYEESLKKEQEGE